MKRLKDYDRCERLVKSIIKMLDLNLKDIRVLTETGSGAFVLTPLIAAIAGAESVVAVTADSQYGTAGEVEEYTLDWAERLGLAGTIQISFQQSSIHAPNSDLVTNLGFIRPLDSEFLSRLPANAVVSLMWEPWEYRKADLDLNYCRANNIPVLGTNENDVRLKIFNYVGMLAVKLLCESGLEIFRSKIIIVGSGDFGQVTMQTIKNNGGSAIFYDTDKEWPPLNTEIERDFVDLDGVVVVENKLQSEIIGYQGIPPQFFLNGIKLVHICGNIDYLNLKKLGISKIPKRTVKPGYMTVTTDYLGPRPVIDLHAAGLKVGESLVRGMRKWGDISAAKAYAIESSPALDFDS